MQGVCGFGCGDEHERKQCDGFYHAILGLHLANSHDQNGLIMFNS